MGMALSVDWRRRVQRFQFGYAGTGPHAFLSLLVLLPLLRSPVLEPDFHLRGKKKTTQRLNNCRNVHLYRNTITRTTTLTQSSSLRPKMEASFFRFPELLVSTRCTPAWQTFTIAAAGDHDQCRPCSPDCAIKDAANSQRNVDANVTSKHPAFHTSDTSATSMFFCFKD